MAKLVNVLTMETFEFNGITFYNTKDNRVVGEFGEGYFVSKCGQVLSLKSPKKPIILKQRVTHDGYVVVTFTKHQVKKSVRVHRLVAAQFIPNPNNLPQVNHIDEIKTNNNVSNLEWASARDNCNHGTRNERISERMMGNDYAPKVAVAVFDKVTGELVGKFDSIKDCAERLVGKNGKKLNHRTISECTLGRPHRLSHGGYTFKRLEDLEDNVA